MKLKKLRLINFRNIKLAELSFNSAFNFFVFYGNNGAGKTSILESISLLNSSKGMQKAKLADVISYGENNFGILATLQDDDVESDLKLTYQANKKELFIDNQKIQRLSQLSDLGNVCWVTPAADRLFYDSKKPRRDFFDRLVYAIDKNLAKNLNDYAYLLQNRMRLLQSGKTQDVWLDKIELDIANNGLAILQARHRYILKLNTILQGSDLEFNWQGITEKTFSKELELCEFDSVLEKWQEILKQNRIKDLRVNSTNFGIHKTDVNGFRSKADLLLATSSMGQHKKALVDLIIGHVKLVKEHSKQSICLLIDEITSHLDDNNKEYLFNSLAELDVQTFLTGVRKSDFSILFDKAEFVEVANGEITNNG